MSADAFLALLVYAFVTSITPGPNNLMLLASGVNFGFVRTIPHALGIGGGFLTLLLAVGFGLGAVLTAFPSLHLALKIAGGDWSYANLRFQDLKGRSLRGVLLVGADFCECGLEKVDLRDADLTRAHLAGARLAGADLRGAILDGIDLATLDLRDVRLDIVQAVALAMILRI